MASLAPTNPARVELNETRVLERQTCKSIYGKRHVGYTMLGGLTRSARAGVLSFV